MKAWLKVIFLGLVAKLPMKVVAWFVVPFLNDYKRVNHPVFGCRDASDLSWWNIAVRNGVHNFFNREGVEYDELTNTPNDSDLEHTEGFQWRLRRSIRGHYVSFRMTWGEPRLKKGKREFYAGWTMGQTDLKGENRMRLTFFQFRPFPFVWWVKLMSRRG